MSEIVETIRKAVAGMIKPDILIGQVMSFNADNYTITVKLNQGPTVEDVTIRSVMNDATTGIFVEPVVGSYVLCGLTDGRVENLSVLLYSEIKSIKFMPSDTLQLKGDNCGGLVINSKIVENLNQLKTAFDTLKTATAAGLNAVGVGSAANGPGGAATFNSQTTGININFEDMENQNVKHGN